MSFEKPILDAAAKIVADFGAHRKAEYFSNFDMGSTFLFYTHPVRLESRAEYELLWDKWETEDGFRVHGCESTNQLVQDCGGQAAVFSHDVKTLVEFAGEVSEVLERETIIFAEQNGSWIAIHEHLSPTPNS